MNERRTLFCNKPSHTVPTVVPQSLAPRSLAQGALPLIFWWDYHSLREQGLRQQSPARREDATRPLFWSCFQFGAGLPVSGNSDRDNLDSHELTGPLGRDNYIIQRNIIWTQTRSNHE